MPDTSALFRLDRDAETSPRRLAILIGVGAVLVLGTLWMFSGEDTTAPPPPVPARPPPAAVPPPQPVQQLPANGVTAAQLTLHGVMGLGEEGAAIIAVGGQQRLVRVGRDIAPGLTLVSVGLDHALIRERGQDVRLGFPVAGGGSAVGAAPAAAGPRSDDEEAQRREAVEYQAGLVRSEIEGEVGGYRIRAGAVPGELGDAGLRPGDIVLRVGGTVLEDPDAVARIPREMRAANRVQIEFVRDGRTRTTIFERPRS